MSFSEIRAFGIIGSPIFSESLDKWTNTLIIVSIIMAIVAYMLGSLNFAIIISKIKYKDDIRKYGSGNAGMTNMVRTYGTAAGVITFLGDILKSIVSVVLATMLMGEVCGYIAGFACILGHVFPIWYKFKGGKGVAVAAAMILTLEPFVFLTILLVFIICVVFTKYISLGSMMAALVYPLMLKNFYPVTHGGHYHPRYFIIVIISILIALLILFLHRENIKRLLKGQESKFSFKKKGTNNQEEKDSKEKRSLHHEEDQ